MEKIRRVFHIVVRGHHTTSTMHMHLTLSAFTEFVAVMLDLDLGRDRAYERFDRVTNRVELLVEPND